MLARRDRLWRCTIKLNSKPGTEMHSCHPSSQEGLRPGDHKFKEHQGYIDPVSEKETES